jgi:hypothetical protein
MRLLSIQKDENYETILCTLVLFPGNVEQSLENGLCTEYDCRFEFNPELAERWN